MTDREVLDMFEPESLIRFMYGDKAARKYIRSISAERDSFPQFKTPTNDSINCLRDARIKELKEAYEILGPKTGNRYTTEDFDGHPAPSPFDGFVSPIDKELLTFSDARERGHTLLNVNDCRRFPGQTMYKL